jgi:DNA-binding PadR family transcriptional regulator
MRVSRQTVDVLDAFLEAPRAWTHGYEISRSTGLKSGTLYPILMRLADAGLLDARWEANEAGKPPRHLYRLTADGLRYARDLERPRRVALKPATS